MQNREKKRTADSDPVKRQKREKRSRVQSIGVSSTSRAASPTLDKTGGYISFLSAAITYLDENKKPTFRSKIKFLQDYFTNNNALLWPANNKHISISLENLKSNNYQIAMKITVDLPNDTTLLKLKINIENMVVEKANIVPPWRNTDLNDLVNLVNFVFRYQIAYQQNANFIASNEDINNPANWYQTIQEYDALCVNLSQHYAVLPKLMLYHTGLNEGVETLWVPCPSQVKNHEQVLLKVCFSYTSLPHEPDKLKGNQYHSYLFNRSSFMELHEYKILDRILRVQVFEDTADSTVEDESKSQVVEEPQPMLDFWCSLDMLFGELRDLKKSQHLSGSSVMAVFEYLTRMLSIKNIYLTDASRATEGPEREEGQIVFRVLMGIAYGQTWYEKYGFNSFSFDNLNRGWQDHPTFPRNLSQDASKFITSRDSLRQMPLSEVFSDLYEQEKSCDNNDPIKRSKNLTLLCNKYLQLNPELSNISVTLSQLTAIVYDAYKTTFGDQEAQKTAYQDLQMMYSILVLPESLIGQDEQSYTTKFDKLLREVVLARFFKKTTVKNTPEISALPIEPPSSYKL